MKSSKAEQPVRTIHILLVDDSRNGLLARTSVLQEHGYQVDAYSSPEAALLEFPNKSYDLIVTDYRMPKMTGTQLIAEIRKTHPAMPVVLVSGVADVLGLDEKSTGANVVVPKSSNEVMHLIRAVKRLLMDAHTPKKPVRSQAGRRAKRESLSQQR